MSNWIDLKGIIDVVNLSVAGKWRWIKNGRNKYINLTIDMRDGKVCLKDRDMKEITLEELTFQRKNENE